MLTGKHRIAARPQGVLKDAAGGAARVTTGKQRNQASLRLLYAALGALLFASYGAIGKDLLHNPVRDAILLSAYDEPYNRLRYLTVLLIFAVALLERRVIITLRSIWFLAPLIAVTAGSIFWSTSVVVTGRNAFLLAGLVASTALIVARNGTGGFFRIQLHFLALVVISSTLLALAVPDIGRHSAGDLLERGHIGQWRGIFGHKNGLGAYAAIATVQLTLFAKGEGLQRAYWWAARLCAVACLVFAGSATSISATIVGFIIYFLLSNRWTSHPFVLSMLGALVIVVAGALSAGAADVFGLFGRDMTLTGRTEIWRAAATMIKQHFLLGLGYGSHVEVMMNYLRSALFSSAVDTHNGYLDVFAAVGLVGFVAFVFAVLVGGRKAYSAARHGVGQVRDAGLASMCVIVMSLTAAIGEVSPFRAVGYGGAIFWMSIVLAAHASAQVRRAIQSPSAPEPAL